MVTDRCVRIYAVTDRLAVGIRDIASDRACHSALVR